MRPSDKPPVDPDVAPDIGYTLGMKMGALIAEWRQAREFGHVIISSQKRDLSRLKAAH